MRIRVAMKFRQFSAVCFLARTPSTRAFSRPAAIGRYSLTTTSTTPTSTSQPTSHGPLPAAHGTASTAFRSCWQRHMSSNGGDSVTPEIRHIGKEEMKQILKEHEELVSADLESPYFVVDVRTPPEVEQTGKLSPSVPTLPVQAMMPPYNALQMEEDDFEEAFGFRMPPKDVTMVFSCAAGVRSISACKLAQQAGYKNCINYMGGAQEWFYS